MGLYDHLEDNNKVIWDGEPTGDLSVTALVSSPLRNKDLMLQNGIWIQVTSAGGTPACQLNLQGFYNDELANFVVPDGASPILNINDQVPHLVTPLVPLNAAFIRFELSDLGGHPADAIVRLILFRPRETRRL